MTTPITGDELKRKQEQFANGEFYGDPGDEVSFKLENTEDKVFSGKVISTMMDGSFKIDLSNVTDEDVKKYLRDCKFSFSSLRTPSYCTQEKANSAANESRFIKPNEFKELISYTPAPPDDTTQVASSGGKRKSKRKHRKSRKSKKSRRKPRKSKKSKKSKKSRKH